MRVLRYVAVILLVLMMLPAAQAYEKTVLIEYYSNTGCGPCAGQHPPIVDMLDTYSRDQISFITFHVNWPSPSDPYYLLNPTHQNDRRTWYGVNAVPWFQAEGLQDANPLSGVLPYAVSRIGMDTPYDIEISDLNPVGDQMPVTVTVTSDEASTGNMRLCLYMIEKHQVYPPGSNGIDDYRMSMLEPAYGPYGETFTSTGGGEQLTFDYTFTIPNNQTAGNVSVIAWVQDYNTKEVFQSRYKSTPEVNISGVVTHNATGEPVFGAVVELNDDPDMQRLTNENGEFFFGSLGEDDYYFTIFKSNFETLTTDPMFFEFGDHDVSYQLANVSENVTLASGFGVDLNGATNVVMDGDYLYIAAGAEGLMVADAVQTDVTYVSEFLVGASVFDVRVDGQYAYLSTATGLKVVDISDPMNPSLVSSQNIGADSRGLDKAGNYVIMAASGTGLAIINVANPANPSLVATLDTPGWARDVVVSGTYAYVADGPSGLSIFDVSDPANPVLAGNADSPGYGLAIDVYGDVAYLGDDNQGLQIYDVTNPNSPQSLSMVTTTGRAKGVKAIDGYVFVANWSAGFYVYNVSNPANPVQTGYTYTPGQSFGVEVDGDYVYIADEGYVLSADISGAMGGGGPATFELIPGNVDIPQNGGQLTYDVHFVYNLQTTVPGVRYWSFATLPNGNDVGPLLNIPFTATPGMNVTVPVSHNVPGFAPAGAYTYTAHLGFYPNSMISDSFGFTKAGANVDGTVDAEDFAGNHGFAELADQEVGKTTAMPQEFALESVYPNPFNPSTSVNVKLPETADLTVAVFNINGQQVATLANGTYQAGRHTLVFDASNMASGLYFVRATVPGELNATQKVMLVR